jgi:hypothetical protein
MKTPHRRGLNPNHYHDDNFETVTFHISRVDVEQLDLQFIADMLAVTLSERTAISLQGRVRFALEADALRLFERGLPVPCLRTYLRTFHFSIPAWPLLIQPDDPWTHLMAIGNAGTVGCCFNSVTHRARYRVCTESLNQFIASLRYGLETTARSLEIPESEWHSIADRAERHLRKLDVPTTPKP